MAPITNLLLLDFPDHFETERQLLRAYDSILQEQRRFGNRLIYLLKLYYPAALKAFC